LCSPVCASVIRHKQKYQTQKREKEGLKKEKKEKGTNSTTNNALHWNIVLFSELTEKYPSSKTNNIYLIIHHIRISPSKNMIDIFSLKPLGDILSM
jgi:hypothetical protein